MTHLPWIRKWLSHRSLSPSDSLCLNSRKIHSGRSPRHQRRNWNLMVYNVPVWTFSRSAFDIRKLSVLNYLAKQLCALRNNNHYVLPFWHYSEYCYHSGFFFLIHTFIKKLWMNSHRHILIYDTFSIIQTIKIFTIQNWEINRTKPCKKRVFFQNCFEYTLLQPVKVNKARIWILEHMFSETLFKVQYNCPACWHRA